ncbi:peptide chain release factor 1, putative [Plasmodium berghei]|uniref:Peptide chain release factor 1, putative n=2 Tax=Plasmodium berghei TaxID=5821 RepID=A0A509AL58_PLABA|nr:peptide chain release factor 1, putative [Plasmodium berghei ANKA]CXI51694.1 peptide chain release factor 1, putative [Plasmodium berghei]SCL94472.1 peptide chain release factor 1, putative [Plasmodium berghei]SCM16035.1 peptide chain release factor 1, putative [Plasmodium berghei]SCM17831.1 peptide chain release factor 1, putative [Plasmodium berghei]SCN26105.1 peptide chain release factor 1, putative [Plasmodium berghei]|eukprot:XP_034421960.1 peptide chain release factor 1, putative [Plasmodium berghei ANKA]
MSIIYLLCFIIFFDFPFLMSSFYINRIRKLAILRPQRNFNLEKVFLNKNNENVFLNKNKNHIRIEFRPGIGGDEAELWSKELKKIYQSYANKKKLKVKSDITNSLIIKSPNDVKINKDGKEIQISLYDLFKNESGTHQVKRIPKNENKEKIQSSTATIAIFIQNYINKYEINLKDLKIMTFRSSKPGGQNVNKIESAVRIVHTHTGIQAESHEERTQELNKKIAMKRLTQKIHDLQNREKEEFLQNERIKFTKDCNRSNRIRTYNFFTGYITDHVNNRKYDLMYFEKGKLEYLFNI